MNESKLTQLHDIVADGLLDRIKSGDASSSDYANAIKFLKDNGINCDGTKSQVLNDITSSLPDIEELEDMYR